jgi:hypothetical protein
MPGFPQSRSRTGQAAFHPIQPLGPTPMNDRFGEAVPLVGTTAMVKVFGCRPSPVQRKARAGVRKPPKHEPAGHRCDVMGI